MEISEGLLGPLLLARSTIDRSAVLRQDAAWLERAWADDRTRVALVHNGDTLLRQDEGSAELVLFTPAEAPDGQRYLLGVDAGNIAYFAVRTELPETDGTKVAGLRQAGALLGDRDAGLLVYAVALEAWHGSHQFCPQCGSRTEVTAGGHVRTCPQDGSQHFPRVDPAVIMAVHDDDDRILLARGPQWPEGRMSVLAGFVEPGESLEQAVIREVLEEVGVTVKAPRYLGSQPWPFPRSLMLGFFARAATTELTRDPEEIAEARWFSRTELLAALESGALRLPPPVSIARRLIETWYGDALIGDW
ncbi:NTP pyrophosphohydrolase [Acrocarpospora phusangensis]|uniref:NAD(+) diphosphatase n=1 Tax=Acrocarpospora phusangensis TaxID=1070424 RepID=A0A919QLG1_9ACTN|nr:NAD(+) diphosphatase [Acrocarpospora phusangensis]GIH28347.1 NTP pyrophosphohydrolase [Acrocarpospora phusangensis]